MLFIKDSRLKELLDPNSKVSSSRYTMLIVLKMFILSIITMLIVMIVRVATKEPIAWEGMAFFLAGWMAILLPVLGLKAYQKKEEEKNGS